MGVDGWLGVDDRVANATGRYALRRGHDKPRKRTVHHARTYAQGRADVSRTSRAHAVVEAEAVARKVEVDSPKQ